MGKRKGGGLTGLSRFVLESFKNDHPTPQATPPERVAQDSQHPPTTPPPPEQNTENRPSKRRKTNDTAIVQENDQQEQHEEVRQWIQKYDATGLVPHYTDASQVPDRLQKCVSPIDLIYYVC
jgi:trimethylguanosine synthase